MPKEINSGADRTELDAKRLLHQLQVHQVELEMQNAELRLEIYERKQIEKRLWETTANLNATLDAYSAPSRPPILIESGHPF